MTLDISAAFDRARIEDHGNHEQTGAKWFQESALFNLCDPAAGVFGYYRIGRHPHLGQANVYSFTSAESLGVNDKTFNPGQPVDGRPVNDTEVCGLRFETIEPMRSYRIRVERPSFRLEAIWTPFFWPVSVHAATGGLSFASGHYNAIGRAVGTVETADGSVPFDAYGYMDHSWGERKNHFPASKWIFACFGEDLFVQAFPVLGADGQARSVIGYAARDGKLRKLVGEFTTGFSIREDWLTPSACQAELRDEDGRVFRLNGATQGPESIYPFLHGKFCVHALARFDLDGRAGKGLLENSPPRAILANYVEGYGLAPDGMWLTPPAAKP